MEAPAGDLLALLAIKPVHNALDGSSPLASSTASGGLFECLVQPVGRLQVHRRVTSNRPWFGEEESAA